MSIVDAEKVHCSKSRRCLQVRGEMCYRAGSFTVSPYSEIDVVHVSQCCSFSPPRIRRIVLHVLCISLPNGVEFFRDDCDTCAAFIKAVISRHTPSHVVFIARIYLPHDMFVQLGNTGLIGRLFQPMDHVSAHCQNRVRDAKDLAKALEQAIAIAFIFEGLELSAKVLHVGNSPLRGDRKLP